MKHAAVLVWALSVALGTMSTAAAADDPIGVSIDASAPAEITSGVVRQMVTKRGAARSAPYMCLSFRNRDARTATLVPIRVHE